MADTEQQVQQPVEQQVTSKTPATKQKNPKRVAAGKATAEKTRIARESQRKALIEAQSIIAAKVDPPTSTPSAEPPPVAEPPPSTITTTQWLSVISIFVSLAGLYYKREEIKSVFTKKTPVEKPRAPPPSPVLPRAPPPSPAAPKRAIRGMD